jgi:hypothetical protein
MQNTGGDRSKNLIFTELSNGNRELGEAFAADLSHMIAITGLPNPKAISFEVLPPSWKSLAAKDVKTDEDIKKLDSVLKASIYELAESYLLYICTKVQNVTAKINAAEYEKFILDSKYLKAGILNNPHYLTKVKTNIKNAFAKISAHGEQTGDNLIDKHDMAAYIYAIMNKAKRENNKFSGFEVNGLIEPMELSVCESLLNEPDDNLMSLKLRIGYKFLNGIL